MVKKVLKDMLDLSCSLFDLIDLKAEIMKKAGAEGQLCNVLKYELMTFMMCLSAVDGRISRVEAQLIREYFGIEVYPIHIKEIIDENGIGEEVYYKRVPECLKIAVEVDNYLYTVDTELKMGLSEIVLELFKVFGKEMVVADDKVKYEEQLSWSIYISMMTNYIADNSSKQISYKGKVIRPGEPIIVDYENSFAKVGRIYTIYYGRIK